MKLAYNWTGRPPVEKLAHLAAFLDSGEQHWPGGNDRRLHGPDYAELRKLGWIDSENRSDDAGRPEGKALWITDAGRAALDAQWDREQGNGG